MAIEDVTVQVTLHDEALEELGLSEQPFIDDKKRNRFSDSTSQKVRATLEQHLRFGESLHLFLGDEGAGKTVFLSQLIKHCKTSIKPFVAKGAENFETVAFLAAVLNQMGGEQTETAADHVDALVPLFEQLADDQVSVVLAIDDAHLAPIEEIAELIDIMPAFASGDTKSTRLLLTGVPRLSDELTAIANEFEGLTLDYTTTTLYPMDEPRVRDYLTTRLNQAGYTDVSPFTDKAISKIHRESGGLPANVNPLAAKYLNAVYAGGGAIGGKGFLAALGWPLLAMGAAAMCLIVWGLSMFFGGNATDDSMVAEAPTAISESVVAEVDNGTELIIEAPEISVEADSDTTELPPITTTGDIMVTDSANTGVIEDDGLVRSEDLDVQTPIADLRPNSAANEQTTSEVNTNAATGNTVVSNITTPLEQTTAEEPQAIISPEASTEVIIPPVTAPAPSTLADTTTDGVDIPLVSEPSPPAAVNVPLSVAVPIDNTESVATVPVVPEATPDPVSVTVETGQPSNPATLVDSNGIAVQVEPPAVEPLAAVTHQPAVTTQTPADHDGVPIPLTDSATAEPAVERAVENERWVLFQEPTSFTVQLATSRERDYIIGLAQSLNASDPVAIYPFLTTNSNNPVFGLLSGLYKTRTQAIQAVEQMDPATKQFGVWIRPISDLQAAIKKQP